MDETIEYKFGHKCVPNGTGDYTFVCPTKGKKPGFIPWGYRKLLTGYCKCGYVIMLQKETFDVWMEGYLATGMEGIPQRATYLGSYEGDTFADACEAAIKDNYPNDTKLFDKTRLSWWGCRMYDNETDARKSFG